MESNYRRRRLTVKPPTLKRGTVRRTASIVPAVAPEYSCNPQIQGYDVDLLEISANDVQFMNRNYRNDYENEFLRHISNIVALHGVKVSII